MDSLTFAHRIPRRLTVTALVLILGCAVLWPALGASAAPRTGLIVLKGATSAEGIAVGRGATFYAGDLVKGDIYRGDLQQGTVERFIDAPDGRFAVGLKADVRHGLLFVAGGPTGQAYVYELDTATQRAVFQLVSGSSFINDVTLTPDGAWFTDSVNPQLHFVPVSPSGALGTPRTLTLTGPAANTSADFNLNGIAAGPDGKVLIAAHSGTGLLYTVNPTTGASAPIQGVSVPAVDGILLESGRLWAVQNALNQISQFRLSADFSSGVLETVQTNDAFEFPTTVARHGDQLAVVNAKLDTGLPPTAKQYEIVVIER
jgi:hypothetical protein